MGCLWAIRVAEPRPQPQRLRWRSEVTAGIAHIWRTTALRQLVAAAACALTVFGFTETIIYAIAGQGLHKPPVFVGVLVTIQGTGAIIGGLTAAALVRKTGEGALVAAGLLATAGAAILEMPPLLASVIPGLILFGISIPWLVVGFTTLIQRRTPPHLQGRAYSAADALVTTPQTVSIALGAALIGVTGYRVLLAAIAAVTTLAAGYLLTRPEQKRAPPVLPTPAPPNAAPDVQDRSPRTLD